MAPQFELWSNKQAKAALNALAPGHRGINKVVLHQLGTVWVEGRWNADGKKLQFPYGYRAEEELGKGRAVPLRVELDDTDRSTP